MSPAVRFFAPASIGNVAAGFDLLGAALAPLDGTLLGDFVTVEPAGADRFVLEGAFAGMLSGDSRPNLVTRALGLFRERAGIATPWAVTLDKRLPVNSGLGSSARSVVARVLVRQTLGEMRQEATGGGQADRGSGVFVLDADNAYIARKHLNAAAMELKGIGLDEAAIFGPRLDEMVTEAVG
ncbi:MAG: hypothetical protein HGA66_11595, partial [Holophaga sp.]|nr:hypothetical protein [Holophaga sp.]